MRYDIWNIYISLVSSNESVCIFPTLTYSGPLPYAARCSAADLVEAEVYNPFWLYPCQAGAFILQCLDISFAYTASARIISLLLTGHNGDIARPKYHKFWAEYGRPFDHTISALTTQWVRPNTHLPDHHLLLPVSPQHL